MKQSYMLLLLSLAIFITLPNSVHRLLIVCFHYIFYQLPGTYFTFYIWHVKSLYAPVSIDTPWRGILTIAEAHMFSIFNICSLLDINLTYFFYILLTVHHVMILGKWPTWRTISAIYLFMFLNLYAVDSNLPASVYIGTFGRL